MALKIVDPKTIKSANNANVTKNAANGLFWIKALVLTTTVFEAENGFLKLKFLTRSESLMRCSKVWNRDFSDLELLFFMIKTEC